MITIEFSQCTRLDRASDIIESLPVMTRCKFREELLRESKDEGIDYVFFTHDEHFLLIAQKLRKEGVLKALKFISVCGCSGELARCEIRVDDQGDMLDDPHHGFFPQRLQYLR